MRLQKYLQEETITTDVEVGADSVTSNKLLRVELKDSKIKSFVEKLKKKKDITVTIQDNIATVDMPFHAPKQTMEFLSKYTV
jgi:hypothetical protein